VTEEIKQPTDAEYVVVAIEKLGDKVPTDKLNEDNVETEEG
jgi:hypothetical protein